MEEDLHNAYLVTNKEFRNKLLIKIAETKVNNKELKPGIDKKYWCETCGSKSGKYHPVTGYCFKCNSDDWQPHNYRKCI